MFFIFNQRSAEAIKRFALSFSMLFVLALPAYSQTITYFQTGEEFCGPFPSWKNIKADFGAKGDGVTDDAAAINSALSSAGLKGGNTVSGGFNVLYFPAGTYRITQTIKNTGRTSGDMYNGMTIIGEDPATTVIVWAGASGGTMSEFDGWNVKFSRLTFDGKSTAGTGFLRNGQFGTYQENSDMYFKNMRTGIQLGGASDQGQAEVAVLRCRFSNISNIGIYGTNMNVMDEYAWDCLFEDCGTGISTGGWHAVGCVFLRSKTIDMTSSWTPPCVINNISIGSAKFFSLNGNTSGTLHLQNKVYNVGSLSNYADNALPILILIDNTFVSPTSLTGVGYCKGGVSLGNTFTAQNPIYYQDAQSTGARLIQIDTKIASSSTLPVPTSISLPAAPNKSTRQVFEVRKGTGSDATEIQTQIVAACGVTPCGIVHIPCGQFSVNKTIVVPAGLDVQIVGDASAEYGTRISWSGTGTGPMWDFKGPSRVTVRDMQIQALNPGADLVLVEKADQVNGRIFCEQVLAGGNGSINAGKGFFIDGIENSDVIMVDGAIVTIAPSGGSGVLVKGGPKRAAGDMSPLGQAYFFFGGLGNTVNLFNVTNGGQLVALGARDEVPYAGSVINLTSTSSGKLTVGAMSFAVLGSSTTPTIGVNGFNGTFTLVGNGIGLGYGGSAPVYFGVSGDGSKANVLNIANSLSDWRDNSSPAAQAQKVLCGGSDVINKANVTRVDTQFIKNNFAQLRSLRVEPVLAKPAGVTDVKFIRMRAWAGSGRTAFTFQGDPNSPVLEVPHINNRGDFHGMQKVSMVNRSVSISPSVKNIIIYDALGKMMWSRAITTMVDAKRVEKDIRSISSHSIVFVRMEK